MLIPTEIRLNQAARTVQVTFSDNTSYTLPAEYLRVESPSAEVQGHGPNERKTIAGRLHVGILAIEPVGNYAVRIQFDDLHDTGIFSWEYLHTLGREQQVRWQGYLSSLAAKGLSRDPKA